MAFHSRSSGFVLNQKLARFRSREQLRCLRPLSVDLEGDACVTYNGYNDFAPESKGFDTTKRKQLFSAMVDLVPSLTLNLKTVD